ATSASTASTSPPGSSTSSRTVHVRYFLLRHHFRHSQAPPHPHPVPAPVRLPDGTTAPAPPTFSPIRTMAAPPADRRSTFPTRDLHRYSDRRAAVREPQVLPLPSASPPPPD